MQCIKKGAVVRELAVSLARVAAGIIVLLSSTGLAAGPCADCLHQLAARVDTFVQAHPKANRERIERDLPVPPERYFDHTPDHGWKKELHAARQALQRWLQVHNEHPYPIVTMEDTLTSAWWAKQGYQAAAAEKARVEMALVPHPLTDAAKQPFDRASVNQQLDRFIATVKSFGPDMQTVLDKAIDNEFQIENLENTGERTVAQDIELRDRRRDRGTLSDKLADRVTEQALCIARIALYRDALRREGESHQGEALKPEYQAFVVSSETLYVPDSHSIRDEYQPPIWAYQKLRWLELGNELNAWIRSDAYFLHQFIPDDKWKQFVEYFNGFSESEKRVLGVSDLDQLASSWRRGRLAGLVGVATSLSGGLLTGGVQLVHWLVSEAAKEADCAKASSESSYLNCAYQLLATEFPSEFQDGRESLDRYFSDPSSISDERLRGAVDQLVRRRAAIVSQRNADQAFGDAVKNVVAVDSVGTPQWLDQTLHQCPPDEFRDRMLNGDPAKGYLAFKYPQLFRNQEILQATAAIIDDSDHASRKAKLDVLAKLPWAGDLAKDLGTILDQRESGTANR